MASVPTGMPAGIWTIESSESWPVSALDSTGTPNTGSGVSAAIMPGRCAAPPAPAMITLKPAALAPLAKSIEPVRRAVGRDDARFVGDAERVQRLGGVAHRRPVGLAAHDDGDVGALAPKCLAPGRKDRGISRNPPGRRKDAANAGPVRR